MKTTMLAVSITIAASLIGGATADAAEGDKPQTSVVLVHGAFADGSSWNKVIPLLQAKGLTVVAVQNPLTSLADDVTATRRVIDAQTGPVVLVGHSWGGTVITEAGNHDKVKALVYVAAFAPGAGETTADGGKGFPTPPGLAHPIASADGFLTLSPDTVAKDFAQDVGAQESNLIAVTQGPIAAANFDAKITTPAWSSRPSWYIVAAKDRMIQPDAERAFAKRIKATTTELQASHVPMVSQPEAVADVIVAAAKSVH
jgi:pimeloyl-ACP methyl ester carboxylesterase